MKSIFPWSETVLIESGDVDFNHSIRASTINRLIQEIAWKHAMALGVGYDNHAFRDLSWVLVRLEFEITGSLPQWGEHVIIHTQPTGIETLYALREFYLEVQTSDGPREFCRGTSSWVMVHNTTRKIIKPQGMIDSLVHPDCKPLYNRAALKISFQNSDLEWENRGIVVPGYNDIDVNDHVNNCSYLSWILDSLPREHFESYTFSRIALNYITETHWGNSVSRYNGILSRTETSLETGHALSFSPTHPAKAVCLGKIFWKIRE